MRARMRLPKPRWSTSRSEEHTSELQSRLHLVCRLLLEKKKTTRPHASDYPCTPVATRGNIRTPRGKLPETARQRSTASSHHSISLAPHSARHAPHHPRP